MNKLEIFLKENTTGGDLEYSVEFSDDIIIKWHNELVNDGKHLCRITIRNNVMINSANEVYTFINRLILDDIIGPMSNIEKIIITEGDNIYTLSGNNILNILTTSSSAGSEVEINLYNLNSTLQLPFVA